MSRLWYLVLSLLFAAFATAQVSPVNLNCNVLTFHPVIRAEGITERTGDIVISCSGGSAGARVTGNMTLFLPVNITNRVAANSNVVTDLVFTADNGSGPQPVNVSGMLAGPATLVFNGLSFTLSSAGSAVLRLANLRVAANQLSAFPNNTLIGQMSFDASNVLLPGNPFALGAAQAGLFTAFSSKIVCAPKGSPLPQNLASFAGFLASNAVFNTTRVTEGFADAFNPHSGVQGLNAASGSRVMVRYTGFPAGARLFVPTAVAGSDAVQPTAGGDFGPPASGGQYAPGGGGSLLLSLVAGTDSNGAGGVPLFVPGAPGSGTVDLDSISEIALTNGAGFAVYEVMDADPFAQESAQFPTFLGLPPFNGNPVQTSESVSFAPVSAVFTATAHDPIPRFQQETPAPDCQIVGDCGANYFPVLRVLESSLQYSAQAGSNYQVAYIQVQNAAGGVLRWSASLTYLNGSGWLRLDPADGVNNGTIRVDALPGNLAASTYQAILTIDAGPVAGSRKVAITLTITPAPAVTPPSPTITAVVNGASLAAGPVVPGSIATVMGSGFSDANLAVTIGGLPAQILSSSGSQITFLVPAALGSNTSAQMVVQVNGVPSAQQRIALAPFAPGIYTHGILNQDDSINGPAQPAGMWSIIQVLATGLSGQGVITARIGDQVINEPYYAGPAPGRVGVQLVDLILPPDLSGSTVSVSVCGSASSDQVVCSPPAQVALSQ
ncbi:MAG TPA: IPT/TIG domain-containing protein [Bryobacteraceae bacterium]|nr:IPT/TIG domain-containing protein [Bryobacteraceae bacterium]